MSAVDTSYALTRGTTKTSQQTTNVVKYLDLDSTYRNRNQYPNPCSFVIPLNYPSKNGSPSTAIDPVINSIPFTGSSTPVGGNTTQSSAALFPNQVALDANEPSINNYYINDQLQLMQFPTSFYRITNYNGTTKVA